MPWYCMACKFENLNLNFVAFGAHLKNAVEVHSFKHRLCPLPSLFYQFSLHSDICWRNARLSPLRSRRQRMCKQVTRFQILGRTDFSEVECRLAYIQSEIVFWGPLQVITERYVFVRFISERNPNIFICYFFKFV